MTDSVGYRRRRRMPTDETRTVRRAVPGHRRGGAPGRRAAGWADRRGLFGWDDLNVDRVGITYSTRRVAGRPSSPVQLSTAVAEERPIPIRVMSERRRPGRRRPRSGRRDRCGQTPDGYALACGRISRSGRRGSTRRWRWRPRPLRCCCKVTPSRCCPTPSRGSPADALPVVTTTWALSHFSLESRLRFRHRLDEVAAGRAVAWVSAEAVGVAPTIPTLGDRRASGHSIIGLAACSTSQFCAPRPLAAVGRRAACCRGWPTPSP